ncbi:MAG: putative two component system sensor histidine kinase [Bacteroidetes bacterium]|nr:putative two component system sensor histidine kinase [Bacteroidota bacterium]
MNPRLSIITLCLLLASAFFSCVDMAPTKEVRFIDSLNQQAYFFRYKNIDSSFMLAQQAYRGVSLYGQGKAEACNNLAFCAFMRMNFEMAERLHKQAYSLTKNELELLIADVGLMKVYQRTAMNKEFYDYRNSAIRRMKRIDEDRNLFVDSHEKIRLNYAFSEFSIVSAIYYYYLQQQPEAAASLNEIQLENDLVADTSQMLYYHYIKGSAGLCEGETSEARKLNEFDELYTTWHIASQQRYVYFEGNGIQGLANLMIAPDNFALFQARRPHALKQFGVTVDTLLPLRLAEISLSKFRRYNDLYQIAAAYVTIGKYLNTHGRYAEALDTLTKALNCVNRHHQLYYSQHHDSLRADILKPFIDRDTLYTELSWMGKGKIKTVPEWISRIREQLSVSYAGMGLKIPSDYNRNIYLAILEYTRQDKQFESRFQALELESRQLNLLLLFVILGLLCVFVLFWIFHKRSKKRNLMHIYRLRLTLDICQKITASIPATISEEEEIVQAITVAIQPDMEKLFGVRAIHIELEGGEHMDVDDPIIGEFVKSDFSLYVPDKELPIGLLTLHTLRKLTKDERALVCVITPYIAWTLDNGMTFISLGDEQKKLEKQRYVYEQHIAQNKRQNLIKKSCMAIVNGINPYIDRIINEVDKLTKKGFINSETIKNEKIQYIDELVTTINEYNDILALWIKMKQGTLSLNIENFMLSELFLLVGKGRRTFEMKHQVLEIEPTDAVVKADKALTLFMINTLTENARKYTAEGGCIRVSAHVTDEYVEISIEDNGSGLSAADVTRILGEKVYDSRIIGLDNTVNPEELKQNKGSGFGLMNCKGIIEKYRKTNDLFRVCQFSVESTVGKGSRFYFRLPQGVRKMLGVLFFFLLSATVVSCDHEPLTKVPVSTDSVTTDSEKGYETLLNEASLFADTAYYCNVIEDYSLALQYADSAINRLNLHYKKYAHFPHAYMSLYGDGRTPAEIEWWNTMFNSDFHVILDIRNEASVSLLALKKWEAYSYNNAAYTSLYKLLGEDQSLEDYCKQLERSTTNKTVGIILCLLLLVSSLIGYYIIYVRKRLINRLNLEQVLEVNKTVFASSLLRSQETAELLLREEETFKEIPQHIVDESFDSVNELLMIDSIGIAVYNETAHKLEFASNPRCETMPLIVQRCFDEQVQLYEENFQALPLIVDAGENRLCVGVFTIGKQELANQETDTLLVELITRYVAIVVFNAVVKLAMRYRDIESAQEETRRASLEDNLLHVQNMVLDNCLSTIKHETIYYPNKIKQIIDKIQSGALLPAEEKENIEAIAELIEYYKGIFTILSSCASRQLEEVTFRRSVISVTDLFEHAEKYFRKVSKNYPNRISLSSQPMEALVVGDLQLLYFLFENLIDEAFSTPCEGELEIQACPDGEYIRFSFIDKRRQKTLEELNQLFYPNLNRMTAGVQGELAGTEYLVCKQIIRDHDEFALRRGCRINAEPAAEGGFTVYFTIPKRETKVIK